MMLDSSPHVRQASHLLIKTLLGSVSSDSISPFFEILVAHLICGLTHIKEKIQLNSLKVLELYLQYYSDLLVPHVGSILPVLIGLLSRQKIAPSQSIGMSKKEYKLIQNASVGNTGLISNPSSDLLSKASKLSVFSLISKLFETLLSTTNLDNLLQASDHFQNAVDLFQDKEKFLRLTDTLVNILLESWVECHPTGVLSSKTPFSQSLSLMQSVINILCMLVKLMMNVNDCSAEESYIKSVMVDLCRKMSSDISVHVMSHFPFRAAASSLKENQNLYVMNFTFCQTSLLFQKLLCMLKTEWRDKFTHPVVEYLGGLNSVDIRSITSSAQDLLICSRIVTELTPTICELSHGETLQSSVLSDVFVFIREFYATCHPHSRSKQSLLKCLSRMFVQELATHGCK